jgi:hypothetical protein
MTIYKCCRDETDGHGRWYMASNHINGRRIGTPDSKSGWATTPQRALKKAERIIPEKRPQWAAEIAHYAEVLRAYWKGSKS